MKNLSTSTWWRHFCVYNNHHWPPWGREYPVEKLDTVLTSCDEHSIKGNSDAVSETPFRE